MSGEHLATGSRVSGKIYSLIHGSPVLVGFQFGQLSHSKNRANVKIHLMGGETAAARCEKTSVGGQPAISRMGCR
jgi:hypothetical protein